MAFPLADAQAFFRFLESSSTTMEELQEKHRALTRLIAQLREPSVKQDARYLLRRIEEEMISRLG